jgi:hypothetical protein
MPQTLFLADGERHSSGNWWQWACSGGGNVVAKDLVVQLHILLHRVNYQQTINLLNHET